MAYTNAHSLFLYLEVLVPGLTTVVLALAGAPAPAAAAPAPAPGRGSAARRPRLPRSSQHPTSRPHSRDRANDPKAGLYQRRTVQGSLGRRVRRKNKLIFVFTLWFSLW